MLAQPVGGRILRHRLGIVDEVAEDDDVGLQAGADVAEQREFLRSVVVSDAEIEGLDFVARIDEGVDDPSGKGLMLGNTPAQRDRIADKGDAGDARFGLLGDLGRSETAGVGPDRDSHELRLGMRAMAMAELFPRVADLDLPRILPHLELVQLAVVENQAGEAFQREQTQK